MFGFLPAPCSTCHRSANSTYRQYFCGLSSALAREYGPAARLFTNRDGTFFSLLAASCRDHDPSATFTTCCNPLGKKRPLFDSGSHANYAAAVSVCGVSTKLRDDMEDEEGARKVFSAVGARLMNRNVSKAIGVLNQFGFPSAKIQARLNQQSDVEDQSNGDWRVAAASTAAAYSAIFEHSGRLEKNRQGGGYLTHLADSGRVLGRIIYLLDAFEDREEDQKRSRFNPLLKTPEKKVQTWFEKEHEALQQSFTKVGLFQHPELLNSILVDGVFSKGASILGMSSSGQTEEEKQKKRKEDKDSCWTWCDCPCDCLPRKGCDCDCDCCPCCDCG